MKGAGGRRGAMQTIFPASWYDAHKKFDEEQTLVAFWAKVDVRGEDDCWLWTAGQFDDGYGGYRGKRAHVFAYELASGPVPAGLYVLHSCDTPLCCNAAHLRAGTQRENTQDMLDRRRGGNQHMQGYGHATRKKVS